MVEAGAALDAVPAASANASAASRERAPLRLLALLLPALLFLGVFFAYPLFDVLARSFSGEHGLSLEHYERFLTRTIYLRVLLITMQIAFLVTVISLLVGYPIAYVMAQASPRQRSLMMMLVLLPFFTSMLVRTYAWMVILSPNGILTNGLEALGFGGVRLIYNLTGVLIGMVYTMLPYMVLTLYSIMKGIDGRLVDVAKSLGASEWSAFWRIYFPLSMPGVAGGGLLVFILSSGFYIVPRLMGGDSEPMLATIIAYQVDILLNWGFASALAVVLLLITLVCFAAYARLLGLGQLLSSKF